MEKNAQMNIKKKREKHIKTDVFSLHVTVNMDNVWYDVWLITLLWKFVFTTDKNIFVVHESELLFQNCDFLSYELYLEKFDIVNQHFEIKIWNYSCKNAVYLFINRKKFSYFLAQKSVTGFKKSNDRKIFE